MLRLSTRFLLRARHTPPTPLTVAARPADKPYTSCAPLAAAYSSGAASARVHCRHLSFTPRACAKGPPQRARVLREDELEEQFVRGWGKGGQKVNKTTNAVILTHTATGLQVKVHATRSLKQNRAIARKQLALKVDQRENGADSVLERQRAEEARRKRKKAQRGRSKYSQAGAQGGGEEEAGASDGAGGGAKLSARARAAEARAEAEPKLTAKQKRQMRDAAKEAKKEERRRQRELQRAKRAARRG